MNISMEEITETVTKKPVVSRGFMQDLLYFSQALALAVDRGFMKREHAGAVWKRILMISGVDTTKKGGDKDGVS